MADSPQRTCVGCREVADQASLIRLVWDDEQHLVVVDQLRILPGRGTYLHPRDSCLRQACRRRAIGRALRRGQVDHEEIATRLAVGWENHADSR